MNPPIPKSEIFGEFVKQFNDAQSAAGLTPDFLATSLKRLIKAKKTDTFKGEVTHYSDGKPIKTEDVVIYSKPLEDNATRRLALQMALNIRGVQTSSPTSSITIDKPGTVNLMGAVAKILNENGGPVDD